MKKFKAAVIGCGRIGFEFDKDSRRRHVATHIGAYNSLKNTELIAVCDIRKERIEECVQKGYVCKAYINFKEMLKKEKIDILSICTPPDTHYPILKEAVEFPIRAIFSEKPLTSNIKEAERMIELCEKKGIILQVDHQRRFDPLHISLRKAIKDKDWGDVQQVNFYYTAGVKNTGSHMFDLLRFFFGEVEWIEAFFSKNKSNKKEDPNLDGLLRFKDGPSATFQACDIKKYLIFELNCFLERGRFVLKDSGFSLDSYKIAKSKYFSGYKELKKITPSFNIRYNRNFMVNAVQNLVRCIDESKDSVSSGKDGLRALELIEASIISANNKGKRIYLR